MNQFPFSIYLERTAAPHDTYLVIEPAACLGTLTCRITSAYGITFLCYSNQLPLRCDYPVSIQADYKIERACLDTFHWWTRNPFICLPALL